MKKKKYYIVDGDGNEFNVEEQLDADETEVFGEKKEEIVEDEGFDMTPEEINALKRLAAVADKLVALVETSDACGKDEDEEEEVEEEEIIDEEEEEFKEEEIVDTAKKTRDSKRSLGAIERKTKRQDDSLTDPIADAWAKRYGGIK